jgi:hypothetical protein
MYNTHLDTETNLKIGGRVGVKSLPLLVSPNQGIMCMYMIVMKFCISLEELEAM